MRWLYLSTPPRRQVLCALGESAILVSSLLAAVVLRLGWDAHEVLLIPKAILCALVLQLCLYYGDLYEDFAIRRRVELFLRISQAFLVGTLILTLVYFIFPAFLVGRGILLIYLPLALAGVLAWRSAFRWAWGHEALRETVLVLGTGRSAQEIAREILRKAPYGFEVVGFLGEHPAEVGRRLVNPSVIGTIADLPDLVQKEKVSLIVVALEDFRGKLPIAELLRCRLAGIRVEEVTSFFERLTGKILVKSLRPSWFVFSTGFNKPRLFRSSKRVGEFLVALVALALIAPLLAVLALLIKLDGPGPILYRQERVGEKGRRFSLLKLRTMRADAEEETGPIWASRGGDPRATAVGRWLRALRLDEIPQLLNVLRGEMSFVGPRPERPHFVEKLRQIIPYYDERHGVKPGITGWAQIKFGYGSNIEDAEEKLQFDLYYIKHMSWIFDVGILFYTLKVVLLGRGAR